MYLVNKYSFNDDCFIYKARLVKKIENNALKEFYIDIFVGNPSYDISGRQDYYTFRIVNKCNISYSFDFYKTSQDTAPIFISKTDDLAEGETLVSTLDISTTDSVPISWFGDILKRNGFKYGLIGAKGFTYTDANDIPCGVAVYKAHSVSIANEPPSPFDRSGLVFAGTIWTFNAYDPATQNSRYQIAKPYQGTALLMRARYSNETWTQWHQLACESTALVGNGSIRYWGKFVYVNAAPNITITSVDTRVTLFSQVPKPAVDHSMIVPCLAGTTMAYAAIKIESVAGQNYANIYCDGIYRNDQKVTGTYTCPLYGFIYETTSLLYYY